MCSTLNIQSEVRTEEPFWLHTTQLAQKEFSTGSLLEVHKFRGQSVLHFKASRKVTILEVSQSATFEDVTCHVVEAGTRKLKLAGEEYFVRGE